MSQARLVCERGHKVTCEQCAHEDNQAGLLDRDRALAHRPGAVFARMSGDCLHAADCHVVVHPDSVTLSEIIEHQGRPYAGFMTRAEAEAWLGEGAGYRDRRRCSLCAPDIPESPETKAGGWRRSLAEPQGG